MRVCLFLLTALALGSGQTPQHQQLNPTVRYTISNSPEGSQQYYMGGEGSEYFDVVAGPIVTRYAEVFWTHLPTVPLPQDIVDRFDGQVMMITGNSMFCHSAAVKLTRWMRPQVTK